MREVQAFTSTYVCKVSTDFFQEKMANLMGRLEFACIYLNGLTIICNSMFEDHLSKLTTVLGRLRRTGLTVNVEKLVFFAPKIEYRWSMLWKRRSHILAQLTDLVDEEKRKSTCTSDHQKTFHRMKKVMVKGSILNYLKFYQYFNIHIHASNI